MALSVTSNCLFSYNLVPLIHGSRTFQVYITRILSTCWTFTSLQFQLPNHVLTQNLVTHSNALERVTRSSKQSTPAASLRGPVRPVMRTGQTGAPGRRWRPRTKSSGETLSELMELGLLWGRQATQNVIEHRRDERRTEDGVGKARVWRIKVRYDLLNRLGLPSIGRGLSYI